MDNFGRHVGTITLAIAALAVIGAVIWQVVGQGQGGDAYLTGLAGLLIGAFLPSPQSQKVTVDNPPSDPVPVDPGHGGVETVVWVLVAILVVVALLSFIR